jgi:hypothetical protein
MLPFTFPLFYDIAVHSMDPDIADFNDVDDDESVSSACGFRSKEE